ncbi:type IV secretory system conjugative DNA transfer family protein [Candidatus Berkelbacteria bacterium]|nr:type IV secretory system conjugative DNA transfer family protein [Candidatus Berkelbacteria bacterium]
MPILIIVFVVLVVGGIFGLLWYRRQLDTRAIATAQDLVVLKVLVPKEEEVEEGDKPKDWREQMSIAEQFLASFSSLYESSINRSLFGQDQISLEFAVKKGLISFYITCPKKLQTLVERQLHSYYPYAQIEPSQEFRIFGEKSFPYGVYLKTKKTFEFPIKTYQKLESDPLNAITNSFGKLGQGMTAGYQIVIRPTSGDWRQKVSAAAKNIAEGKDVKKSFIGLVAQELIKLVRPGSTSNQDEEKPVRLTPIQEETMKDIQQKGSKVGFETQVRLIVVSPNSIQESRIAVDNIVSAFAQYTSPESNLFTRVGSGDIKQFTSDFILRRFRGNKSILNTEELASIYHIPNHFVETPNIEWLAARTLPPPANLPVDDSGAVKLGKSVFRGEEQAVNIKQDDRRRHLYAIGKTGVGKTTLFIHQIEQDIKAGRGVCYIDPNGDAIEEILTLIPKERAEDVVYFNPSDAERPIGLNMLEWKRPEDRDFLVAEWLEIFYKLFDPNRTGMVGPQFEHWGRNASLSVMSRPEGGTLLDIPRLFTDDAFRDETVSHVTDPVVLAFWNQQMAKTADFHKSEMYNYFISKFGRFMTNDLIRNVIGQTKSGFDIREIMDSGKIFLINLSKGRIGETNSYLLGMILVSKIQVAAFQRADTPEEERKDFYLYVDEFQNFTTDTFKTILSEARKYRLNLNITNQYIAQLPEDIRDAVIGNAGTLISFRIGAADAEFMSKEFPNLTQNDLVNLNFANTYIKLLIDGTPSNPFSMRTIKVEQEPNKDLAEAIKQLSRLKYGQDKQLVEQEMLARGPATDPSPIQELPPSREGNG